MFEQINPVCVNNRKQYKDIIKMGNNTMKNIFKVSAIACLMATASSALAGPSANVQVKGTVVQGACTPSISNSGVADFGDISIDNLSSTGNTSLPAKSLNLTINCSAPTLLTFVATDNRSDSSVQNYFGLGKTPAGANIGYYSMFLDFDVTTNFGAGNLVFSQDGVWYDADTGDLTMTWRPTFAVSLPSTTEPVAFTSATFVIGRITPVIYKENRALKDEVSLDGNATISLIYL
jgi:type 1 fimbria pilin